MWRFAQALATGRAHVKVGLPCQDRVACTVLADGTLLAAVADGAGSAAKGERGAEIAVHTLIEEVRQAAALGRTDLETVLREAAARCQKAVVAEAIGQGFDRRDLASTLLAVAIGPDSGAALQLGDGVIVVSNGGDGWGWVFWPQRGEYANTTYFLTDADAMERICVEPFSGKVVDVALMTDGLEPLVVHYGSRSVHEPFFNGIFQPLHEAKGLGESIHTSASLETFLASERVAVRTDDDLSLVLATRRS